MKLIILTLLTLSSSQARASRYPGEHAPTDSSLFQRTHNIIKAYRYDMELDHKSGFTWSEIENCQVIVKSNSAVCDPDGDIKNGDIDKAI